MLRHAVSIAVPALVLSAAGCARVPPRPPTLPALAPGINAAPVIAGGYQDKGTIFSRNGEPLGTISLSSLLFGRTAGQDGNTAGDAMQRTNIKLVVLVGPRQDVFEAQSWQGDRQLASRQWQRLTGKSLNAISKAGGNPDTETYRWHNQFLMLFTEVAVSGPGAIPLPIYRAQEQSLQMRKGVDGSLLVFQRDADTLVLGLAPFNHHQDLWYRFPPALNGPRGSASEFCSGHNYERCRIRPW